MEDHIVLAFLDNIENHHHPLSPTLVTSTGLNWLVVFIITLSTGVLLVIVARPGRPSAYRDGGLSKAEDEFDAKEAVSRT